MDLFDRTLKHDAWTTARLLDCASELSDRALDQRFEIGHQTVRATFVHIIANVQLWTDLMSGQVPSRLPIANNAPIGDLKEEHDAASKRLYSLGREIVDAGRLNETFIDSLDDPPRLKSYGAGLLHVATHGMHHRAQLLHMLRRLGARDLPEGDALSWEKQHVGGWNQASLTE